MPHIDLRLNGEGALFGIPAEQILEADPEQPLMILGLESGMRSGAASVAICFKLPDGHTVFVQTSLALFVSAADALRAKYLQSGRENPGN